MYAIGSSARRGFGYIFSHEWAGDAGGIAERALAEPTAYYREGFGLPVAVVAPVVGGIVHGLQPSSGSQAQKAVPEVVASANNGNLVAVQVVDFKRGLTSGVVASERAVWQTAWGQISPAVIAAYNQFKSILPPVNYPGSGLDTIQSSVNFVLSHTITIEQARQAASGGQPLPSGGGGGVAGSPNQAVTGGGFAEAGIGKALFSPLGLVVALGLYMVFGRKRR